MAKAIGMSKDIQDEIVSAQIIDANGKLVLASENSYTISFILIRKRASLGV